MMKGSKRNQEKCDKKKVKAELTRRYNIKQIETEKYKGNKKKQD